MELEERAETEVEGSSETPAGNGAGGSDDVAGLLDRYTKAGIDLRQVDPERLAQATKFHEQYGKHSKLYTPEDVSSAANEYLARALQSPEGRQQIRQFLGLADGQPKGDDGEQDPVEARFARHEQGLAMLAQMLQKMYEGMQQGTQKSDAEKAMDKLESGFRAAVSAVPGANGHRRLQRLFYSALQAGELPPNATPRQIQKWVSDEVNEWGGARGKKPPPRVPDAPAGGVELVKPKKGAKMSDYADLLAERLGLS